MRRRIRNAVLTLLALFTGAWGCSSPPTGRSASRYSESFYLMKTDRVPTSQLSLEECWAMAKKSQGDYLQLADARIACETHLREIYDLLPNPSTGAIDFEIRFKNYQAFDQVEGRFESVSSGPLSAAELRKFLELIRKSRPTEDLALGARGTLTSNYGKLELISSTGARATLASVEDYLEARARECQRSRTLSCEDGIIVSPRLNWIHNSTFGISYALQWDGAKFGGEMMWIAKLNGDRFVRVQSIDEIIPESDLLKAMLDDWIIRNSDAYETLQRSKTVHQFVSNLAPGPSGYGHRFLSYSIRLPADKRGIAIRCARAFDTSQSRPDERGLACLKKNRVTLYEYRLEEEAFHQQLGIRQVSPTHLRVAIPFGWESAIEYLRFDIPFRSSTYSHFVDVNVQGYSGEFTAYSRNRCTVRFNGQNILDASQPSVLSPDTNCEAKRTAGSR